MTTIRTANANDADRLAELSRELGYPVEPDVIRRRLERLLAKPDHIVLVMEGSPGMVLGWIHAAEHDILEVGCFCEIQGLVVAANRRGEGIGWKLVERVERWAAERGLEQVSVRSNVVRAESHPFYERAGYLRVKTQHVYHKLLRH
jgi:N-acetylglutamate synthase-like GNAT family acetyltransferase